MLTGSATPGVCVWFCNPVWLKVYVCVSKVSTDAGLYAFPNLRMVMRGMLDPRCELSHFRNIKVLPRSDCTVLTGAAQDRREMLFDRLVDHWRALVSLPLLCGTIMN